jgi:hypothetical protein
MERLNSKLTMRKKVSDIEFEKLTESNVKEVDQESVLSDNIDNPNLHLIHDEKWIATKVIYIYIYLLNEIQIILWIYLLEIL